MDRASLAAGLAASTAELRQQLALISATGQLLEQTADSRERRYLAALSRSVCRMLRSVGRIELAHRLTDEHDVRILPVSVDLAHWAEDLTQKAGGILAAAGIGLELDAPDRLPFPVDRELLECAALEMISAAAEGGDRIRLSLKRLGDKVSLTVSAEGEAPDLPALPEELRGEEEPMGLALIRLVARLHGGALVTRMEGGLCRALTVILAPMPGQAESGAKSPLPVMETGGFDPMLVAFSYLLPEEEYLSEP